MARNAAVSLACQAIALLLQFVGRAVFVKTLGRDYLGVSGLFTNVLTVLSFAELGIGNAMIFSMYKPLAENDTGKLNSLMTLYKKAYRYIGLFIAVAGVCLIPFMDLIIREKPAITDDLTLIYLLYLFNSVSSYFFVYKKSIITADQKLYIVNLYHQVANVLQVIFQIVFLLLTHNFIVYLLIQIIFTVLNNAVTARKANKMYPFLREPAEPVSAAERSSIFKDVKALAMYKLGSTVLNGTDNIIVTAMFSVGDVGLVSNYVMINSAFTTILGRITEAFTASIGNLNVDNDREKQYSVFKKLFFLCAWMFGFVTVGILLLASDVVTVWLGSEYVLDYNTVVALAVSFYVSSMQYSAYAFRTTSGLFVQGRFAPVLAAVLNIVLSILLARMMGLCGIFFATAISRFGTVGVVDGILIFRKRFKTNPLIYFGMYFAYAALFAVMYFGINAVISQIALGGIAGLAVKIAVVTVIFNLVMIMIFGRTSAFRELMGSLKNVINKKKVTV